MEWLCIVHFFDTIRIIKECEVVYDSVSEKKSNAQFAE